MQCTNCSFINPAEARFCQNCGKPLENRCPNCGTINETGARFCKNCGFQLAVASGGARLGSDELLLERLAAAAPAPLAEKMRASAHLAGERRIVTVLFADVVGSTSLAEQMDPEDWTAVMNRAFDLLTPVIYRYEGTIARLMGDALLAFFGAPVAHEDDPVRAVSSALDLLAVTRQYAAEVHQRYGVDFAIRVGLNTGQVVVGEVGSNLVYEYTAMGDAVNLAARMQAAAAPSSVLITENTYRFVAPLFETTDLGLISVKGKTDPVQAYAVSGFKRTPGRLRGLAGLESPMVGREAELQALLQLSSAVQAGLGRVALIIGEAGLGKTRLVAEWKAAAQAAGGQEGQPALQWVEGRCLSYGQGLAYHLLVELLRSLLGVSPAADESETRSALQLLTTDLFGQAAANVYPYLGHLLSLPLEGEDLEKVRLLDPQSLQAQYLTVLRQLLQALAARRPLVLVLEDIHWADPSSTELLVRLLPLVSEVPVLFCCLTRPDNEAPGWKLVTALRGTLGLGLTEINLRALSENESRQLVANLLELEALPENVRNLVLRKAEGNPFFVEEVIRMLIDRGMIVAKEGKWVMEKEVDSVDIPDTLQGLLLARIDRLPEEVKRTLRVAAVIGRQFSVRVLEQVLSSQG